ncbi:MAG: ferrous iron transport protein A [Lentisphaerae bacterium]|nr:ferrous iron transport protein A [Lentisphaerota bacterium]
MSEFAVGSEMTLADLPIGCSAVVLGIKNTMRSCKKFADAGMVPGAVLSMESHAPLGGLLRIKLMGSSLTLHKNDGRNIMVKLS